MLGRSGLGCAVVVTISLLLAAGCGSSSPPSIPIGTVADSGFRPQANGLPFQNYGVELSDGAVPINLTAADVEKMFGDGVCADPRLRRCDLIPEAQAWLNDTNEAMSGGHCYGFSVLAELLWLGQVKASTFGAAKTHCPGGRHQPGLTAPDRLRLGAAAARLGAGPADHRYP